MKGYKAFEKDLSCRGFQYEIGKTYHMDGDIEPCRRGFHFCKKLTDCFKFYDMDARVCEIEASGAIAHLDDKSVCGTITIVRELEGIEKNRMIYGNGYGNGYGEGYSNGYDYGSVGGYSYSDGDGNGGGYSNGYGNGYGEGYGYSKGGKTIYKILVMKGGQR